jgi:hypothetical protein
LYYSDIGHNYVKSGEHFKTFNSLCEPDKGVARTLYREYLQFFPITDVYVHGRINQRQADSPRQEPIVILSFHDKHEHASRCLIPPLRDSYFALCQAYSLTERQAKFETHFSPRRLNRFRAVFALSSLLSIAFLIWSFFFAHNLIGEANEFERVGFFLNRTLEFRWQVSACWLDSLLIYNYHHNSYGLGLNNNTNSPFLEFLLSHLHHIYDEMVSYKSLVDSEVGLTEPSHLPGCEFLNCTFSYLFSSVHNIGQYYAIDGGTGSDSPEYTNEHLQRSALDLLALTEARSDELSGLRVDLFAEIKRGLDQTLLGGSIVALALLCSMQWLLSSLGHGLRRDLFLVIRTVPATVLNEVASMFEKISQFTGSPYAISSFRSTATFFLLSLIFYLSFFVFPLYVKTQIRHIDPKDFARVEKAPLLELSETTEFLSFVVGLAEFSASQSVETTIPESCVHHLVARRCFDCFTTAPALEESTVIPFILAYLFIGIPLILWFCYVMNGISLIQAFIRLQDLLGYIPERARNSNPVFQMLSEGKTPSMGGVEEFRSSAVDLSFGVDSDLCVLYFGEDGSLISYRGNPVQFLPALPTSVYDVEQQLIEGNCATAAQIQHFFDEGRRGNCSPVSVSIRSCFELSLSFSHKGSVLLLTNNSHHYMLNQQLRNIQSVVYSQTPKSETVPEVLLLLFQVRDSHTKVSIKQAATDLELRDTRYHQLLYIKRVQRIQEDCETCLRVISRVRDAIGAGKCVLLHGGPIYVFGAAAACQMTRGRVFGAVYDAARQSLNDIGPGEAHVQESLACTCQGYHFEDPVRSATCTAGGSISLCRFLGATTPL